VADFRGKVVLLFFGFTQCPDVCPTALASAVEVLQTLGDDGSKVQVLFVSLDPERDTPDILQAYVSSFHPSFIGLRTDLAGTAETAAYFKVYLPQGSRWAAATPWTTAPSPMCLTKPVSCGWLPSPGNSRPGWRRMSGSC
jgi:protein SCO1/2